MEKKLTVSEAFFSFQGEGKTMGVPSVFIRLAGCNLMCGGVGTEKDGKLHNGAKWRCDSIEVWRKGKSFTPEELVKKLDSDFSFTLKLRAGAHLIITGGEPMLQQEGIINFLSYLQRVYAIIPYIEIETNGTIAITEKFHLIGINKQFNVSPKLSNSGESINNRRLLREYIQINSQFKYVVANEEDLREVNHEITKYSIPVSKVWLMPAASDRDRLHALQQWVLQSALEIGCNYSHRLHIEIFNQRTGV